KVVLKPRSSATNENENYFDADYGKFAEKGNSLESKTALTSEHKRLYKTFVANSYRMSLFLLAIQARQKPNARIKSQLNLKEVKLFLSDADKQTDSQIIEMISRSNYKSN
ncbi:MAG: hypothetical protein H7Z37_12805, partial [Pyrinomonadaceae bacterium]|nr:hypothetical protein [Pyrinomonadaceae bacterium]